MLYSTQGQVCLVVNHFEGLSIPKPASHNDRAVFVTCAVFCASCSVYFDQSLVIYFGNPCETTLRHPYLFPESEIWKESIGPLSVPVGSAASLFMFGKHQVTSIELQMEIPLLVSTAVAFGYTGSIWKYGTWLAPMSELKNTALTRLLLLVRWLDPEALASSFPSYPVAQWLCQSRRLSWWETWEAVAHSTFEPCWASLSHA